MPAKRQDLPWWKKLVQWIKRESTSVEIILLPFGFFIVDLIVRSMLRVNISDAGADMSLLAISTLVSSLFICIENGNKNGTRAGLFLVLVFLALWMSVLWLVSSNTKASFFLTGATVGLGVSLFIVASFLGRELNNNE